MPVGWVKNEFNVTVPMSTYLVAIIVADLKFVEAEAGLFNKPVRVRLIVISIYIYK
jgi:aminopeptidase N